MAKKLVIGLAGATLVGLFLFGTRFFGYIGTGVDSVKQAAQDNVPFEWNLQEARKLVQGLDGDVAKLQKAIAKLSVETDNLDEQIVQREQSLNKDASEMLALRNRLGDSNTEFVSVGGKEYTSEEVTKDLVRRKNAYDRNKNELANKTRTRSAHAEQLDLLKTQLDETLAQKEELQARIAELETKKTALDARKSVETVTFDDTKLNEAKQLLDELDTKLKVEEKIIEAENATSGGHIKIDLSEEGENNILDQIDAEFEGKDVKASDHKLISIEK